MNSWQSAGEAHKNKPVVQFLAMVMRLEIITGNWGSLKVKIQQLGHSRPYFLGAGNPFPAPLAAHSPTRAFQVCYPEPGAEDPLSAGIWERCVLLVRLPGSTSSPAHLWGGD